MEIKNVTKYESKEANEYFEVGELIDNEGTGYKYGWKLFCWERGQIGTSPLIDFKSKEDALKHAIKTTGRSGYEWVKVN